MTIAAIVSAKARERVISRFLEAAAFSSASAIAFPLTGNDEQRLFERLERQLVIRSDRPGFYYLDQDRLSQVDPRRYAVAIAIIAIAVLVMALAILIAR